MGRIDFFFFLKTGKASAIDFFGTEEKRSSAYDICLSM